MARVTFHITVSHEVSEEAVPTEVDLREASAYYEEDPEALCALLEREDVTVQIESEILP